MPNIKLTAKAVERLRAPTRSGKQELYWDTHLRGFGVLVSGTTNGKSYVVQREVKGKTRRVTLGPTNVLKFDKASKRAELTLADLYRGVDPKAARTDAATLRETLEAYLVANSKLRENSRKDYRLCVERHLSAWLDCPLRDITAEAIVKRHGAIAETIKAEGRYSGQATADGAMRVLRLLWSFAAESNPSLPPNPTRSLSRKWFNVDRRKRLVKNNELPSFYAAVRALPNSVAADYLTLILFTGLRRTEAATLTWPDIDLSAREIHIPKERTKSGRELDLPLTDYVRDLLVARRALGQDKFVFPGPGKGGYLAEPKFFLNQVALATGITVSVHDLRRTYITVAESCDISPMAHKALVNHSLGKDRRAVDVTEGYVQMTVERLRGPAQKVCERLKELCGVETVTGVNIAKLS
jgi:integrase